MDYSLSHTLLAKSIIKSFVLLRRVEEGREGGGKGGREGARKGGREGGKRREGGGREEGGRGGEREGGGREGGSMEGGSQKNEYGWYGASTWSTTNYGNAFVPLASLLFRQTMPVWSLHCILEAQ